MAEQTQSARKRDFEQEVLEWADAVYDEAERELADSREIKLTSRLIDYITGQQWTAKARFGRSRPTVNRLFRQFIEMAGLLTDIEPDFKIKFLTTKKRSIDKLEDLLNEMIGLWARMTDFESELTQSVMWALLHTGYAKVQWNPAMNNGMGDCEFMPLGPMNVMTIGAGKRIQDDECVIARWPVYSRKPVRTFGDLALGVEPDLDMGDCRFRHTEAWPNFAVVLGADAANVKRMMGIKPPSQAKRSRYPRTMLKQFWFKDSDEK